MQVFMIGNYGIKAEGVILLNAKRYTLNFLEM